MQLVPKIPAIQLLISQQSFLQNIRGDRWCTTPTSSYYSNRNLWRVMWVKYNAPSSHVAATETAEQQPGFVRLYTEISSYEGFLLTQNCLKRITRYCNVCVIIINGLTYFQLTDNFRSTQTPSQQCLTLVPHVQASTGTPYKVMTQLTIPGVERVVNNYRYPSDKTLFLVFWRKYTTKYCINRVTVQDISWACYVFVKCLRCTVFILYVVMVVFSTTRVWLPWQQNAVT